MKRIALIAIALPGMAQAHGLHAPLPDHAVAHAAPVLGLAVVALAALVALRRARP